MVFDVDGTISFDGVGIDDRIAAALVSLSERRRVIFASARPIRDLLPVLPPELHENALIGGNGAFTRSDGKLTIVGFSPEHRHALDTVIDEYGVGALVDGAWDYSFTGDEMHPIFRQLDAGQAADNVARETIAAYSKVVLFTDDPAVIEAVVHTGLPHSVHVEEKTVDIAPSDVTKLQALHGLGVRDGEYIAFGNDANDIAMLQNARTSYRVGRFPGLGFATHTLAPSAVESAIAAL